MLDVNETIGKSSCSSLQKEFSLSDVMFTTVDVTRSEDLVSDSSYNYSIDYIILLVWGTWCSGWVLR